MKAEIQLMTHYLTTTQSSIEQLLGRYDEIVQKLQSVEVKPTTRFYFIGNGSSGQGVRIAAYFALKLFNQSPLCITPFQFTHYTHNVVKEDDIVIAISQSGTSHQVVESIRLANQVKATTIAISATEGSPVVLNADVSIVVPECIEKVGYKVTGVIGLLYTMWIVLIGIAYQNKGLSEAEVKQYHRHFKHLNQQYDIKANQASEWTTNNIELLDSYKTLTVLGSGTLTEAAMELAVKVIEVENRFVVALDTEEFLHGVCATDPKDNLIIMLVDEDSYEFSKKVYDAIKQLGQSVIWIGTKATEGDLLLDVDESDEFIVTQFLPAVHAMVIKWAQLKDYGDYGSTVFKFYQQELKVRENHSE